MPLQQYTHEADGEFTFPRAGERKSGAEMPDAARLSRCGGGMLVAAVDHLSAARLAVGRLQSDGYIFEDLVGGQIHQLEPSRWTEYVERTWCEMKSKFPTQAEIFQLVETGGMFFGPFAAWNRE